MTCDWGDCDELAEGWRINPDPSPIFGIRNIWLPVCPGHGPTELVLAS